MAWCLAVIAVVQTPDRKWGGACKGANSNAARVESGGAGVLSPKFSQLGKSPKSNSGESSHIGS